MFTFLNTNSNLTVSNTDSDVIKLLQNGDDKQALKIIYANNFAPIRKYITRNNGSKDDALEVFHDAVLVFYDSVQKGKFNFKYAPGGFIYTVAKNIWITRAKRDGKSRAVESDEMESLMETSSGLKVILDREKKQAIDKLFSLLGEGCRELLKLSMSGGENMRTIAEKLGFANENVAKSKNYRCKQRLKDLVGQVPELQEIL